MTALVEPVGEEHWELANLARAVRLCDWMFEQFAWAVRGGVVELGAGIGTFSERLLAAGADHALLVEPDPFCAAVLDARFGDDPRVEIVRETLPDVPTLAAREGRFDFALCQNVLEHVEDDSRAVATIASSLRHGGQLALLVPAHPRLFGSLDRAFGHRRRYSRERVRRLVVDAGLSLTALYSFNLLGVPGWWAKNKSGSEAIGQGQLNLYERLVRAWRPVEELARPPWGLSLVAQATKT